MIVFEFCYSFVSAPAIYNMIEHSALQAGLKAVSLSFANGKTLFLRYMNKGQEKDDEKPHWERTAGGNNKKLLLDQTEEAGKGG